MPRRWRRGWVFRLKPSDERAPPRWRSHKVFCLWPHSLQAYSTRPWRASLVTRLGAPHLLHFTSSRVWPRVMVTFRAIASLTKRSDSWRIASFDIAGARGFRIIQFPCAKKPVSSLLFYRAQMPPSPLTGPVLENDSGVNTLLVARLEQAINIL